MLPCRAARARRGLCSYTLTLPLFVVMLGAGASQTRADPEGVPQRVQGSGSAASELSVKTSEGVVDTSFSVSIREIADLLSRLPDGEVDAGDVKVDPSSKGDVARIALPPPKAPRRFDIWAEGRHRQDASSPDPVPSGEVYVGADYDISPVLTVGALAGLNQFEPADTEAGDAWSGGPYARVRLMSNLSLTGLATWHRPETVNGEDAFDPAAEADRFRIINQLRGDWTYGAWRFKPSVGYEVERSDGRKARMVNFGPAIGYRHERPDGTVVEPHLAVKGRWDVAPIIGLEDDAYIPSWDGLDAKLEGGVRLQDFKGWSLDASTSVGGVGDPRGTIDWRGRLGIKVPLN